MNGPAAGVVLLGPIPPWRSGIADQTVRLARAMTRLGAPPLVITFSRMYPRALYPGAADRGEGAFPTDVEVVPLLDGFDPLSFRRAAELAASRGARLVAAAFWTSVFAPHLALFLSSHRAEAPDAVRLLLCHNLADHEAGPLRRALARTALRRSDVLAVQNAGDLATARREVSEARAVLVPHPAEPAPRVPRAEARRLLGLPAESPLFLFSGLLRLYKGWDVLLEAFSAVRREIPDALLVLAGEPWGEAKALAERPAPDGVLLRLRFLPPDERGLLFDACDAVVCPYRHATGSGIAADALSHGRPVIGSDVPGLSVVVRDGTSGLLVSPGDPGLLAGAMLRFVREGLGVRLSSGAEEVGALFSPEGHARTILALGGIGSGPAGC
ncbi:MAG TPA: glycosyltransferase family 4 protein [Thermoanaerobaculia bacterium]|nr:glycosyltransferase family 4 protein [Thermoanaerobaculia bacterium]HQN06357.1 glycosyltransferase family 4 protein [Thermoanaerobaculia bacterium]HQP86199.1 glycosyltransferase family 4 protein [Thermoanaerobaculia bacterium]